MDFFKHTLLFVLPFELKYLLKKTIWINSLPHQCLTAFLVKAHLNCHGLFFNVTYH